MGKKSFYSMNDMHYHLLGLNAAAMAGYHMMSAYLFKQGLEASLEKLDSMFDSTNKNMLLGATVAIIAALYLAGNIAVQNDKKCNRDLFHKKRLNGAAFALVGLFTNTFFLDYWARLSCWIAGSFRGGIGVNLIITGISNFITFHAVTSGFCGGVKTLRANFADGKKLAFVCSIAEAGAMSVAMLGFYLGLDVERQPELSIIQGALGGVGALLGGTAGLVLHSLYDTCCGDPAKSTRNRESDEEAAAKLVVNLDDDDNERLCC